MRVTSVTVVYYTLDIDFATGRPPPFFMFDLLNHIVHDIHVNVHIVVSGGKKVFSHASLK